MDAQCSPGELLELQEDQRLAELVQRWNFVRGREFEILVFSKFRSAIHHPSSPRVGFHLLAVFRRYTFRLSESSVSIALHSVLRGSPPGFHVTLLKDRHFRFSVASKHVGFEVWNLKCIIMEHFDVYFHLWRDGGADWIREWFKWQEEEAASWKHVSRRRIKPASGKMVSFASKLAQDSPVKKSSPSEIIHFGEFACNLDSPSTGVHVSSSNLNLNSSAHQPIPAKSVFGHLKQQPGLSTQSGAAGDHDVPTKNREAQLCYRCLGLGHFIRHCKNSVRCRFYYSYGHIQRKFFRWKAVGQVHVLPNHLSVLVPLSRTLLRVTRRMEGRAVIAPPALCRYKLQSPILLARTKALSPPMPKPWLTLLLIPSLSLHRR
jgi:hypothetical protein